MAQAPDVATLPNTVITSTDTQKGGNVVTNYRTTLTPTQINQGKTYKAVVLPGVGTITGTELNNALASGYYDWNVSVANVPQSEPAPGITIQDVVKAQESGGLPQGDPQKVIQAEFEKVQSTSPTGPTGIPLTPTDIAKQIVTQPAPTPSKPAETTKPDAKTTVTAAKPTAPTTTTTTPPVTAKQKEIVASQPTLQEVVKLQASGDLPKGDPQQVVQKIYETPVTAAESKPAEMSESDMDKLALAVLKPYTIEKEDGSFSVDIPKAIAGGVNPQVIERAYGKDVALAYGVMNKFYDKETQTYDVSKAEEAGVSTKILEKVITPEGYQSYKDSIKQQEQKIADAQAILKKYDGDIAKALAGGVDAKVLEDAYGTDVALAYGVMNKFYDPKTGRYDIVGAKKAGVAAPIIAAVNTPSKEFQSTHSQNPADYQWYANENLLSYIEPVKDGYEVDWKRFNEDVTKADIYQKSQTMGLDAAIKEYKAIDNPTSFQKAALIYAQTYDQDPVTKDWYKKGWESDYVKPGLFTSVKEVKGIFKDEGMTGVQEALKQSSSAKTSALWPYATYTNDGQFAGYDVQAIVANDIIWKGKTDAETAKHLASLGFDAAIADEYIKPVAKIKSDFASETSLAKLADIQEGLMLKARDERDTSTISYAQMEDAAEKRLDEINSEMEKDKGRPLEKGEFIRDIDKYLTGDELSTIYAARAYDEQHRKQLQSATLDMIPIYGTYRVAKDRGLTSGWTILSIVGDAALLAGPLVKATGAGLQTLKSTGIGVVSVPLKGGSATQVWKGIKVLDTPIVGKSAGKWTIGKRSITYPKVVDIVDEYRPQTKIEMNITGDPKAMAKMGMPVNEINKILDTLDARSSFYGKKSPYFTNEVITDPIKSLDKSGVETVLKKAATNDDVAMVYGSGTIKQQIKPELRDWRSLGDIDIQLKTNDAGAIQFAKELRDELAKVMGNDNVKIDPKRPKLIQTKDETGWHHAVDIHSKTDDFTSLFDDVSDITKTGEWSYGAKVPQKTVTVKYPDIGKFDIMSLSESGTRKADTIIRWFGKEVKVPGHRVKDIIDYYVIVWTYEGKLRADQWAKAYGINPDDMMRLAKEFDIKTATKAATVKELGWKFDPTDIKGKRVDIDDIATKLKNLSPEIKLASPGIKTAAIAPYSVIAPYSKAFQSAVPYKTYNADLFLGGYKATKPGSYKVTLKEDQAISPVSLQPSMGAVSTGTAGVATASVSPVLVYTDSAPLPPASKISSVTVSTDLPSVSGESYNITIPKKSSGSLDIKIVSPSPQNGALHAKRPSPEKEAECLTLAYQ